MTDCEGYLYLGPGGGRPEAGGGVQGAGAGRGGAPGQHQENCQNPRLDRLEKMEDCGEKETSRK